MRAKPTHLLDTMTTRFSSPHETRLAVRNWLRAVVSSADAVCRGIRPHSLEIGASVWCGAYGLDRWGSSHEVDEVLIRHGKKLLLDTA